ncbi:MAG: hypothetical protein ACRD5R_07085, partial [Candidatus Acidiferrales bacterium]
MARGWDSKAVEDQVQEHTTTDPHSKKKKKTPAQIEVHRRREVLLLSRARVQKSLESSSDARYREQLDRALADLDAQIA